MGLFDGLLGQLGGNVDIKNLAQHVGLNPDQVEAAIAALARAHPEPGDTVAQAAGETGIDAAALQRIVAQLGGEGSLGHFASLIGQGGAGGLLGGMFGKS